MTQSCIAENLPLLILGSGEIARCLATLARDLAHPVTVCEPGAAAFAWPTDVNVCERVYAEAPWPLPAHTQAVIARGHVGDAASLSALLNHGAERVYLIASSRRALAVMEEARAQLADAALFERLSAPAGVDLGGRDSAVIALSILAEIHAHAGGGSLRRLSELREERARQARNQSRTQHANMRCPGQRP